MSTPPDLLVRGTSTSSPIIRPALLALLALALVVLSAAPRAGADLWSPTPPSVSQIPEVAEGSDPLVGRRERNDLAVAADGAAWLAWNQTDDQTNTIEPAATHTVRVSHRLPGGTWSIAEAVGSATRAAGTNYDSILGPRIGVDGAGVPTVVWAVRTSTTSVTLYAATRTGGSWGSPVELAVVDDAIPSSPTTASFSPTLDVARNGSATVAWQDLGGVRVVERSASGAWSSATTVVTEAVDLPVPVGVGRDREGQLTVAWRAGTDNADRSVRAAKKVGSSWEPETVSTTSGFVSRIGLVVDDSGAAVLTWGSNDGPRAAHRAAGASATWEAPQVLASGSTNAASTNVGVTARATSPLTGSVADGTGIPSAAIDQHGTATVVWPDAGDGTAPGTVRLRTVDQAGTWSAPTTVATEATTKNAPLWPRAVVGRNGAVTVIWSTAIYLELIPGAGASYSGGLIRGTARESASAAWSTPVTYHSTSHATFGTMTATGQRDDANLSVAGDRLGNATLAWSPYKTVVTPSAAPNEAASHAVTVTPGLDWTARGLTGSTNLRTWVDYLYAPWPGPGPTTDAGVQASNGAEQPVAADRYSWRLTQQDAWRTPDGKTIVQYKGTIRWVNTAHYIDNLVVDPRLEIAPNGSARIYVDGQASGTMAEAMAGNPSVRPVQNVRLIDLQLPEDASRLSADGTVRSWVDVKTTANVIGASEFGIDMYASQPFGSMTISIPANLAVRDDTGSGTDDGSGDGNGGGSGSGGGSGTGTGTGRTPGTGGTGTTGSRALTGKVKGSKKAKRKVTVTTSRTVGARSTRTYRVVLRKGKRVVATGTLKARTLRLTVRNVAKKGRKASYPRIRGSYTLASPTRYGGKRLTKAQRITSTRISIR